jgi:hypothetical protein
VSHKHMQLYKHTPVPPFPNKGFASAHPGSEPRAQLIVKTEKMINIKKEQNVINRCRTMPIRLDSGVHVVHQIGL